MLRRRFVASLVALVAAAACSGGAQQTPPPGPPAPVVVATVAADAGVTIDPTPPGPEPVPTVEDPCDALCARIRECVPTFEGDCRHDCTSELAGSDELKAARACAALPTCEDFERCVMKSGEP